MAEQRMQAKQELNFLIMYGNPQVAQPCLWLVQVDDGKWARPTELPTGIPLESAIVSAPADGTAVQSNVTRDGSVYDVMTVRHGDTVRQAVFDTTYQRADLNHLLRALILVGILGIVLATAVGALLGRRSIMPLGDALARQRRFIADASHELRTPLTRLHTRAQLLLRWKQDELPDGLADELSALVRSSRELNDVVEDLLVSAGLRSDPSRRERVDLAELTASAVEAEQFRLASRSLVFHASPATVYGAASPLRRMIMTLLDNAISHTDENGRIQVTLRPVDRGRSVELEVADNGTGFDPADSERIFERFAQSGHSGPRRFGLGLALAREIATDHGATIRAVGCLGSGATFTIKLPVAPESASRVPKPAAPEAALDG
jgi:two-component system OmpR family sensor kinase